MLGSVELRAALGVDGKPSDRVLRFAAINSLHHTGYANPIDDAILARAPTDLQKAERYGEIPYDFMRKRLSILAKIEEMTLLIEKGAVESVLSTCSKAEVAGSELPLAEAEADIRARFETLSNEGYRVLAVAYKTTTPHEMPRLKDESEMTFAGLLLFDDPAKEGVQDTLEELASLGISLRMVTGDNRLAATPRALSGSPQ